MEQWLSETETVIQKDNNQIRKQLSDKWRKCSRGKRRGSVRAAGVTKFASLPKPQSYVSNLPMRPASS